MTQLLEDLEADGFGHYLAGFIDGEGSFFLRARRAGRPPLNCGFALLVRDDDAGIIRELHRRTGLGKVTAIKPRRSSNGTYANPQIRWYIDQKHECYALVEILDWFPLRAKKANDYAIWREAVMAWGEIKPGFRSGGQQQNWDKMLRLKADMEASRLYPTAIQ